MKKPRKPLSAKQKANLLTGQLLRKCSCTPELIKLLEDAGEFAWAERARGAYNFGRHLAYKQGRAARAEVSSV